MSRGVSEARGREKPNAATTSKRRSTEHEVVIHISYEDQYYPKLEIQ